MNHSFISLVLMPNCPKLASDFRPISLRNVCYNIFSKLPSRLKEVRDKFTSSYQAIFLSFRQMTYNIVLAHELVNSMRKCKAKKKRLMAIKLEMSKSFDKIE